MKKIVTCVLLLSFVFILFGCDAFSSGNSNKIIDLKHSTYEMDYQNADKLVEQYNLISIDTSYYVVDNYSEYLTAFCNLTGFMVEPLSKEDGDKMFRNSVRLFHFRIVSGSESLIPVSYKYDLYNNNIIIENTNASSVEDLPDVVIGYYIDIVTMPKSYFDRYKKSEHHSHNYNDGVCYCMSFDEEWLNENFRLTDELVPTKVNVEDEFATELILVLLKHSPTYIKLSKKHFGIEEITKVNYISSTPPDHFYEEGNEDKLNNFCQMVFLYVNVDSKERIIELIKELEKLPFVKCAEPDYIMHLD